MSIVAFNLQKVALKAKITYKKSLLTYKKSLLNSKPLDTTRLTAPLQLIQLEKKKILRIFKKKNRRKRRKNSKEFIFLNKEKESLL